MNVLRLWIRGVRNKLRVSKNLREYCKFFQKNSVLGGVNSDAQLKRNIIVGSHVLEKGFTHDDYRAGFGEFTVRYIIDSLKSYKAVNGKDVFAVNNAESILANYHKKNLEKSYDDSSLIDPYLAEVDSKIDSDSIVIKTRKEIHEKDDFPAIAYARHSVRYYNSDCEEIDNEILRNVAKIAQSAPSACNRQATHLYVLKNRKLFDKFEEMQLGCSGFGANASAFILICSDLSLYDVNEEKLPIYDAGIYTMNLLYALQTYNLYACPLNAFYIAKNPELYQMVDLPSGYDIQGVVAVYNIPADREIKVAASHRRQVGDFLHIVED